MHMCLQCGKTWGEPLGEDGLYSHGFCSVCFKARIKPSYHKEQRKYSGIPCFGEPPKDYHCPEYVCKYYDTCREFTEYTTSP